MKQKNVKFNVNENKINVNENKTTYSFGKFIGATVGMVVVGFVIGMGIVLATKVVPLSTQVLTP